MRVHRAGVLLVAAITLVVTACGKESSDAAGPNAPEQNAAGDIPDDQVFLDYTPPSGGYTVKVPEGWGRTGSDPDVTFTDKLNSVRIEQRPAAGPPTEASFRADELPALSRAAGFGLRKVTTVGLPAGQALLVEYGDTSVRDPVTGRTLQRDVLRYEFWRGGREVVLTLAGPKGADNVDPWNTVSRSLRWPP